MSEPIWEEIRNRLAEHGYMSHIARSTQRIDETAEVFTPDALVLEMLQSVDISHFAPGKTVLDPACGDGQFLMAVKWLKILAFDMDESAALADIYGVDIMRDNVNLCKQRIGGGTILMGDALNPGHRLEGQTEEEYTLLNSLLNG